MVIIKWINCTHARIDADDGIIKELHEKFSFRPPGWRFSPKYKSGRWDGWIRLVRLDGKIPTGLVSACMKYLLTVGYKVSLSPEFSTFLTSLPFDEDSLELPFPMWDHQVEAVNIALQKKRRVILSPTSSGKTLIAYCIARTLADAGLKVLIIVPSVMLVTQLRGDFESFSELNQWDTNKHLHTITAGDEKQSDASVVASTWQSLQNITSREYFAQYDAVIGDEVHGAKADELSRILEMCTNAFYRIGMTGTLDGAASNEMTIEGHFGPQTRVATTADLQELGHVSNVEIECHIIKYTDPAFLEAVRGLNYAGEIGVIVKKKSRNQYISRIVGQYSGNTLILCRLVEDHVRPLAALIQAEYPDKKVYTLDASVKKEDREAIRRLAEIESNLIIIATYDLFSTGVSIKNLHNVIFAHPMKASIKILQSIGRTLRLHDSKECAKVIDIADDFRGKYKKENYALKHFMIRAGLYTKEKFPIKIVEASI